MCPGAGREHGQLPGERDQREWSGSCVQPLGSFPHLCPECAVRLSGGSQLHLGNSEAGLQEDTLPGKSV